MKTIALVAILALVGTANVSGSFFDTVANNLASVPPALESAFDAYSAQHPDFAAELAQLEEDSNAKNADPQGLAAEVVALAPDLHALGPAAEELFDVSEAAAAAAPTTGRKLLAI